MAADRDLVRWLVAPDTGELLDVGAETYRPSTGCSGSSAPATSAAVPRLRPPRRSRARPRPQVRVITRGGKTVRVNLGPLCRQHHNAKTHGRWRSPTTPPPGRKTWTSPLGRTYRSDALNRCPVADSPSAASGTLTPGKVHLLSGTGPNRLSLLRPWVAFRTPAPTAALSPARRQRPVVPSSCSRRMSAWPACRAVSCAMGSAPTGC